MMKKLGLLAVAGVLVLAACKDESLAPVATFDTLSIGAFPRLVQLTTGEYDLANLSNSSYVYEVDFVDGEAGQDIAKYDIYVSYDDRNPENGTDSKPRQLFKSFAPSDFRPGPNGNLGLALNIPANDLVQFFGLDPAKFLPGDRFRFRTEVTKEDGRVFSNDNSTSAIGNAFSGYFNFDATLTCPLKNSFMAGEYKVEYVGDAPEHGFGFTLGKNPPNVTLKPVAGSSTRRTFTVNYLPDIGGFSRTFTLDFACNKVRLLTLDTGLACAGGSISLKQTEVTPFDLSDDSTLTLKITDFATDGGCGIAPTPFTIKLTKV